MHVWRNYLCYKCFPHYTENQSVCCQILGSIKIMHAHWGGIQSLSLDPEWEIFIAEIRQPRVKSGDWFLLADCCESKLELKVVITSSKSDTTYIQGQSSYSYLVWFKRKKKDKISQLHRFFPEKKKKKIMPSRQLLLTFSSESNGVDILNMLSKSQHIPK